MMLTSVYDNLSVYGQPLNLKSRMALWRAILEQKRGYSMSLVLNAIIEYCDKNKTMPAPSDIVAILSPERPKISHAEFIHANEQWAKEGYPTYSANAQVVRDYREQENEGREKPFEIADNIKQLAKVAIEQPPKQIGQRVTNELRQPEQGENIEFKGEWSEWDADTKAAFVRHNRTMTQSFYKFIEPMYGLTWDELQEQIKAIG